MAGRIPQTFLDQLLSRVDLVELIDGRVPLRKTGRNYTACCPFHSEKTPSFNVSPIKQFYHCFGCGAHGNAIGFLMAYERMEFPEAVETLARALGLELPHDLTGAGARSDHSQLYALLTQAEGFFRRQLKDHPQRQRAIDYLRGRGLDGEIVRDFGIGYAPPGWDNLLQALTPGVTTPQALVNAGLVIEREEGGHYDRFRDRIMFPIRDRRGRVIAFGGRTLGDATPKYLNSPETPVFHKGRELYGFYEARASERQCKRLLVVEGYMDVVALAQFGIRYAVATLGTATTPDHLERLLRACPEIVFCFDGDRAGRAAAWPALENALPLLRDGRQAGFLFLPEAEDPDTLVRKEGREAFEQRLEQAMPLSDYLFQQLTARADLHSLDGRARFVDQARPLLNKVPEGLFRELLWQRLGDIAKIAPNRLVKFDASKPAATRGERNARLTRTLPRRIIALLLQRPTLAEHMDDLQNFKGLKVPGLELLVELVELLRAKPAMTFGAICERYRGTETESILSQLAEWEPLLDESLEQMEAEFVGNLAKLRELHIAKQPLDDLLRGVKSPNDLSVAAKEQLRRLSKARGDTS